MNSYFKEHGYRKGNNSLFYYYEKYRNQQRVLFKVNVIYLLLTGGIHLVFHTLGVNRTDTFRINTDNQYSTSVKGVWLIVLSIQQYLLGIYTYYNQKNIRIKVYVLDLLKGIKKEEGYDEISKFIKKSGRNNSSLRHSSIQSSLFVSNSYGKRTSLNESSASIIEAPDINNTNLYKENYSELLKNT